ncbi:TetR/AcrR family transcriptional regulator [Brevibacterium album]|uniref:TetR/AcrR family transcriptional regulator n=1 Tax=Brevibacterium album TaxID=417948 RepID=UPI00040E09C0|nr:TetR/AcrR family transcriptional regulator [Brevibacterium album]
MSAREAVLDAFEAILIGDGERAATIEAVAARAQVSKGGLLYHFGSKSALIDGLLERLRAHAAEDLAAMRQAPGGRAAYYISTSVAEDSPFDRTLLATVCLAQGSDERARAALQEIRTGWLRAIDEEVGDSVVSSAILLMGDGLYYNASLTGPGAPGGGAAHPPERSSTGTEPAAGPGASAGTGAAGTAKVGTAEAAASGAETAGPEAALSDVAGLLRVVETLRASAQR